MINRRSTVIGLTLAATASAAASQETTRMVDPRTILFSMPTLANDAPPVDDREVDTDNLAINEDEWRQTEFFASARLHEIQQKLIELKAFEAASRRPSGWAQIYSRDLAATPVVEGGDALRSLATSLGVEPAAAPFFYSGASSIIGNLRDGFSLSLGPGAAIYGTRDGSGIGVLAATLQNADDRLLTNAFAVLNRSHRLLLVDWRLQMLLSGTHASGDIIVWRP